MQKQNCRCRHTASQSTRNRRKPSATGNTLLGALANHYVHAFTWPARALAPRRTHANARTAHAHAMLMHAVKVELHNHRPHTTPNTTRSTRARALAFATSTCCHAPRRHTRHRGPCHAPKRRAGQAAASANARRLSLGRSPRACAKGIARLGLALLKETVAVQYRAGGRASETRGAHERRGSFIRGMHASGMPMPVFFS